MGLPEIQLVVQRPQPLAEDGEPPRFDVPFSGDAVW